MSRRRASAQRPMIRVNCASVPKELYESEFFGHVKGAFTGAVGYSFLYYVLALRLGKELALAGHVPAIAAAWATNLLFFVVGLALFVWALWR